MDQPHGPSRRYWIELTCACIGTGLFILTLIFPDWIEAILHVDLDRGNGTLEIGIAVTFLAIALISTVLARRERLRMARAST